MSKSLIKSSIKQWECFGRFGYGQGRAVAEFGEKESGDQVCYKICPDSEKCRSRHLEIMDLRFPAVSGIVKETISGAVRAGLPIMQTVVAAMNVAVNREIPQALRIKQGLKKYQVSGMVDHYIYGQLENIDNGVSKKSPDVEPIFQLVESGKLD